MKKIKKDEITNIISVCTLNYAPYALIALRSCKKYSPSARANLFIADGTRDAVVQLTGAMRELDLELNIFIPDDLSLSLQGSYFPCFGYYNAFEVSNLAKYVGVKHIITQYPMGRCIYIDTDVYFFGDVLEIIEQEARLPIILSPHQLVPSTDDAESEYLLHGWINSGFSVFDGRDDRVHKVLDWLIYRISRRGYLAPQFGLSGDQPWLSGVPFVFHDITQITDHDGINVAYWNITERKINYENNELLCNGKKLIFFHFSGFIGAPNNRLSKHSEIRIAQGSALEKICSYYRWELDKVSSIVGLLSGAKVLSCSKANLSERLRIGSTVNGINIDSPTSKRGLFSRIGGRLDAVISRVIN
jgi:hypothetical protein